MRDHHVLNLIFYFQSDVYSSAVTIVEVGKTIYTKNELCDIVRAMEVDIGIPTLVCFKIESYSILIIFCFW